MENDYIVKTQDEIVRILKECLPSWHIITDFNEAPWLCDSKTGARDPKEPTDSHWETMEDPYGFILKVSYVPELDTSDRWAEVCIIQDFLLELRHCNPEILPLSIVLHEAAHVLHPKSIWFRPHTKVWKRIYEGLLQQYEIAQ